MPYINTDKKAAKMMRNVSLSIGGIYDKLALFVNQAFTSFFFPNSLTGAANLISPTVYSCVLFVKGMPRFAMSSFFPLLIPKSISHVFCVALSTNSAIIFCNISILQIIFMPFKAMRSFFSAASFVFSLLKNCSPLAIFRAIISVIVNSINLMFFSGLISHIIKKIIKTFNPSSADRYTSSAVIFIMRICGIAATLLHIPPNAIMVLSDASFSHGRTIARNKKDVNKNKIGGYLAI